VKVKGSFFIGRKSFVCEAFGEAAWTALVAKLAAKDRAFASPILTTSLLPVESYLLFQETLVGELFRGDDKGYWIIGRKSGEWALTEGPYKALRAAKENIAQLTASLPRLWDAYFTEGVLEARLEDGVVHVRIHSLPVRHISFELTVMAFGERAIELCSGKPPVVEAVRGVKKGDPDIYYRFRI
jgi:hypothetical protein